MCHGDFCCRESASVDLVVVAVLVFRVRLIITVVVVVIIVVAMQPNTSSTASYTEGSVRVRIPRHNDVMLISLVNIC